jgi:hypothetical protein
VDSRTISRVLGATCLVAGPLAAVAYELVTPVDAGSSNVARQLAEIDANRTAMNIAVIFGAVGLLLIPAVLFAARIARRRTPGLAIAAGSIAFAGYLCGTVVTLGDPLLAAAAGVADRAAAVALAEAFWSNGLVVAMLTVYVLGHSAGMVLLGAALWRARVLPGWAAAGIIGATPLEVGGVISGAGHATGAIAYGLVAVAFVLCAVRLLRTPNDSWDLAPAPQPEGALPGTDLLATR